MSVTNASAQSLFILWFFCPICCNLEPDSISAGHVHLQWNPPRQQCAHPEPVPAGDPHVRLHGTGESEQNINIGVPCYEHGCVGNV